MKSCVKILALMATTVALSLPLASCRSSKSPVHTYRPYSERHPRANDAEKAGKASSSSPCSGEGKVDDAWGKLEIKLGPGDNRKLYEELRGWLGVPYTYGGHSKQGTDCSGMVMEVYGSVYGIALERSCSGMLEKNCTPIAAHQLREGDLVFFITSSDGRVSHVGIYLKENKFVHASSSRGVVVSDMRQNYYQKHFCQAGRVVTP